MKGILKKIGALTLVVVLFTQSFATSVYAAEMMENVVTEDIVIEIQDSSKTDEVQEDTAADAEEVNESVSIEEILTEEKDDLMAHESEQNADDVEKETSEEKTESDEESIVIWIEKNIPDDYSELLNRPQEWWDSLTEEQLRAAKIFAEQTVLDNSFYHEQPLDEVIEILENGKADISIFFDKTIFQNMTLERLYELKEKEMDLNDLAEVIFNLWDGEESVYSLEKEILELAVSVSGISMVAPIYTATDGEQIAKISTTNTGYTNGKGLTFWILKDAGDGSYAFCLDHGKSCSRTYIYGNMKQITGESAWLIENYGTKISGTEGYMVFQMAVWALQDGSTSATVRNDAYAWFTAGGFDTSKARLFANSTEFYFNLAKGKNGTCWVVEGPAGSQRPAKPTSFVTNTYSAGGTGGGIEEAVEPEFDTVEDSITVSYEVKVKKTDWQTGVGLAGCKVKIYEDGSKVDTVTTNSAGKASYQTSKTASFTVEYCTNYDDLTSDQQADIDCCASLAEAYRELESQKSAFADQSYTYSCKEATAPAGYVWKENKKSVSVKGNESATLKITNERTLGAVTLIKYDTESE